MSLKQRSLTCVGLRGRCKDRPATIYRIHCIRYYAGDTTAYHCPWLLHGFDVSRRTGLNSNAWLTETPAAVTPFITFTVVRPTRRRVICRQVSGRWRQAQCSAFTLFLWPWRSTALLQRRRTRTMIWLEDFLTLFNRCHTSAVWIESIIPMLSTTSTTNTNVHYLWHALWS